MAKFPMVLATTALSKYMPPTPSDPMIIPAKIKKTSTGMPAFVRKRLNAMQKSNIRDTKRMSALILSIGRASFKL